MGMKKMETFVIFFLTLFYFLGEGNTMFGRRESLFVEDGNGGQEESVLVVADMGTNHSLPCGQDFLTSNSPVMWGRQGYGFARNTNVQPDGSLFFTNLQQSNAGLYSCQLESYQTNQNQSKNEAQRDFSNRARLQRSKKRQLFNQYQTKTWYQLKVRTPPFELRNVTVLASTILASVMWEAGSDGGYPISSFHIRYRLKNETEDEDWINCQPDLISPMQRHYDVFHLCPKSTYVFEVWANNQLGQGVSTFIETETHNDLEEIQVGKYLLEGVDTFDTRIWVVAVAVVLGTLCLLGLATCCLLYKEYYHSPGTLPRSIDPIRRRPTLRSIEGAGSDEEIELIPNIIFNPVFDIGPRTSSAGSGYGRLGLEIDQNLSSSDTNSSSSHLVHKSQGIPANNFPTRV